MTFDIYSEGLQIPHVKYQARQARQFVLRVVPDLGYFFGLPFQVLWAKAGDAAEDVMPGLGLATVGACVREGFDMAEKLALRQVMKGAVSRVGIHHGLPQSKHT